MVTLTKKLQQIESGTGLQATYHNGDYTVSVWYHEADLDSSAGYELVFCKSTTDIAHSRDFVPAEKLESEMRKYQPDLRKWHKIEYGE